MGYDLRHGLGQARRQGPVPAVRVRRRRIKVSIETRFLFFFNFGGHKSVMFYGAIDTPILNF